MMRTALAILTLFSAGVLGTAIQARKAGSGMSLPIKKSAARSLLKSKRSSKTYATGLGDFVDLAYSAEVTIGGVQVPLLLDTGSADLWSASTNCTQSSCGNISGFPLFETQTFKPTEIDFTLDYGDAFTASSSSEVAATGTFTAASTNSVEVGQAGTSSGNRGGGSGDVAYQFEIPLLSLFYSFFPHSTKLALTTSSPSPPNTVPMSITTLMPSPSTVTPFSKTRSRPTRTRLHCWYPLRLFGGGLPLVYFVDDRLNNRQLTQAAASSFFVDQRLPADFYRQPAPITFEFIEPMNNYKVMPKTPALSDFCGIYKDLVLRVIPAQYPKPNGQLKDALKKNLEFLFAAVKENHNCTQTFSYGR
ncbi:hypothetical protein M422DRAFT_780075 [Sphaerobolus stellatus SS14]|uniref:Peptidase A1 domain-containing protein n=1 Tax=Sphaerobolus stellatus (strain SS14) TaxID=990650 RepID=A0A0C9VU39_SPHS4|nr:hypothetical protein M422DRAFT_780075 [Sphaerobolus stellatus SS14]